MKMKAKMKVEFPCGYKYSIDFEAGIMSFATMSSDGKPPEKCPLHGKNCPRKK